MKKTHKAVLRSSLVMLSLLALAVVSSGVAQAQECIARAATPVGVARAEGITEAVGDHRIEVPGGAPRRDRLGFGSPAVLVITVELNTRITSEISDTDREVAGPHIHGPGRWVSPGTTGGMVV